MSDQRSDAPLATEAEWLARFLSKRGMGACICEGQEIHAAVSEIDRLRTEVEALKVRSGYLDTAVTKLSDRRTDLVAENEKLRAALVAAMEIVQKDRVSLYECSRNQATGEIEPEDEAAIAELDAIIAQADAAMGSE